jgi:hypothetical protein
MPNAQLRQMLVSRIREAIERAIQASAVEHAGLVGRIREIAVETLFRPLLPADFDIGTGKIVDCHGTQSDQIDVLIHSKRLLPPLMYDTNFGLFPLESCFRAIEVKSTLTATEWDSAITSARKLRDSLKYLPGQLDPAGRTVFHDFTKVARTLFAFKSDLASKDELQRYKERDLAWNAMPAVRAFCVVGSGTWAVDARGGWLHIPPTSDYDEVIEFLLICSDTLRQDLVARKDPRLRFYLSRHVQMQPLTSTPESGSE